MIFFDSQSYSQHVTENVLFVVNVSDLLEIMWNLLWIFFVMDLELMSEILDTYWIYWTSCFLMFKDILCLQTTEFQIYL